MDKLKAEFALIHREEESERSRLMVLVDDVMDHVAVFVDHMPETWGNIFHSQPGLPKFMFS